MGFAHWFLIIVIIYILLCLTFINFSLWAKHVLSAQDYSFIGRCYYYPYLTDEETKVLRNWETHFRLYTRWATVRSQVWLTPDSEPTDTPRTAAAFASALIIPAPSSCLFPWEYFSELSCVFKLIYWTFRGVSSRSFYHSVCHNSVILPENPTIILDVNTVGVSLGLNSWWWF